MSIGQSSSGGKTNTETDTSSAAGNTLGALAMRFAGETDEIRTGLIDVMQEVLSTGGSTVPIISRSVEQSRQAGSDALQSTSEDLARSGLAGTPMGETIRAQTKQQNEIAAGNVGQSLAQMIFQMIPNFVSGQAQNAISGLSGAVPGSSYTDTTTKGFGQTGSAGATAK